MPNQHDGPLRRLCRRSVGRVAEGDSIARLAARLDSVTAGCAITACDVRHPRFATTDLTGQRIVG